jgi:hypothetical protein
MGRVTKPAKQILLALSAVLFLLPALCAADSAPHAQLPIEKGFDNMYNLDFPAAHREFNQWEAAHPDDPMGPVCHGAALLFTEFARLGILESQLFIDDDRFDGRRKLSPDPQTKQQFLGELDKADALADKALQRNSEDANAEFAQVLSFGLRSDYAALIEKKNFAAIRLTKQGRELAEVLLKQKPDEYDASDRQGAGCPRP